MAIMLTAGHVFLYAACIRMSFWPTADVNDAVHFVIWLHKVSLQLFRLKFVVFFF